MPLKLTTGPALVARVAGTVVSVPNGLIWVLDARVVEVPVWFAWGLATALELLTGTVLKGWLDWGVAVALELLTGAFVPKVVAGTVRASSSSTFNQALCL
jgi:hypothetical protein